MNNGTDRKPTPGQLREIMGCALGKVAEMIAIHHASATFDEVQALLASGGRDLRDSISRQLAPIFVIQEDDPHRAQRALWEKYFREHFSMEVDLSEVRIPTKPTNGKWRLIMIPKGLTMNHAVVCYKAIICAHNKDWNLWQYQSDLDASVTKNARTPLESYAIWVRDEPEPDKDYLGKSALAIDSDSLLGVTLLERLVHGIVHFVETKKHLDEKGWTICTGSRSSDGGVPYVGWYPDDREVFVNWCNASNANPRNGLRQKFQRDYPALFCCGVFVCVERYLIQPFVIFDVSTMSRAIRK